jgi:hypothetical protein
MKRQLLFSAALAFAFGLNAQNSALKSKADKESTNKLVHPSVLEGTGRVGTSLQKPSVISQSRRSMNVNSKFIGSSKNQYSTLTSVQNCLNYNEALNTLVFAHRQNQSASGGSGVINATFSTDGGATWDSTFSLTSNFNRYPSGVIFNPAGNTNPQNAYAVVAGPSLYPDLADWNAHFFAHGKLDKSTTKEQYILTANTPFIEGFPVRQHMQADNQGRVRIMGYTTDTTDSFYTGAYVVTGTYDAAGDSFVWNAVEIPGTNMSYFGASLGMAWSADGQTGYVVVNGIDTTRPGEIFPYPHIWKTTNGGQSYSKQPYFDFATVPTINDSLINTTSGAPRPFFTSSYGFDYLVDGSNNLHIITAIAPAYSNHPDSTTFSYTFPAGRFIYDIYQTGGSWGAKYLATIKTDRVANADSPSSLGWDSRIAGALSSDGKVFVSYLDTKVELGVGLNLYPDVWLTGWNPVNGNILLPINTTDGSNIDSEAYWLFMADRVKKSGSTYTIHTTVSSIALSDLSPQNHFYLEGMEVEESEFISPNVSVNENASLNTVNIFPNPAKETAFIKLVLNNNDNVKIELINTLGQAVSAEEKGNLSSGNHLIQLNVNQLNKGVNFCRVTMGNEVKTLKINVQ